MTDPVAIIDAALKRAGDGDWAALKTKDLQAVADYVRELEAKAKVFDLASHVERQEARGDVRHEFGRRIVAAGERG